MRGLRMRNVSDDGHRWSLEPVLRSESHPVFVQPVKDYVMKRWRVFRSRSRNHFQTSASSEGAGKRPDYQRSTSSTSRDSIQLNRRTQIMTMIQGSCTSIGPPALDASPSPLASQEQTLTSAEASHDCINPTRTTAQSEPLIASKRSDGDLPIESAPAPTTFLQIGFLAILFNLQNQARQETGRQRRARLSTIRR